MKRQKARGLLAEAAAILAGTAVVLLGGLRDAVSIALFARRDRRRHERRQAERRAARA